MTDQLRQELEDRLEKAEASGNQQLINEARRAIDHHTLECQAHTADRVKRIESDVSAIKTTVEKINDYQVALAAKHEKTASEVYATKDEIKDIKAKAIGAKQGITALIEVLKWIAAVGGGGVLFKVIQTIPVGG